jgi:hypothetical protein
MCAAYTVSRTGHVDVATRGVEGEGVTWMAVAGPGAAVRQSGTGIAFLEGGKTVWRSRSTFRAQGVFAEIGPDAVAFSYDSFLNRREELSLYVAPFGGKATRVAADEQPLGWTAAGNLLTWRYEHGVFLRDARGRLLRRVSGPLREIRFGQGTRTLLAISRDGVLERYRSGRWSQLADLNRLGLDRHSSFERLAGGLIGIVDQRRVVVLRPNGTVFASARFASGDVAGESGLVANADETAVAFVVSHGSPAAVEGRETVELLRAGARRATSIFGGSVPGRLCVRWTTLAWHGRWLLDSVTSGKTLVLDTTEGSRPLDLTQLVDDLAPHGGQLAWA